jgi:type IV pilus assembly protein PilW
MIHNYKTRAIRHGHQTGLSMIELLVALAIGSFLIIGAVTLQSQTRRNFDVGEQQARLQESARYVIAVLEPQLQLAGVYGFSQDPSTVSWYNGGDLTTSRDMRMAAARAPGLPDSITSCGNNFAVDVLGTVTATNGAFDLACAAQGGGAIVGTDLLVLRHSAPGNVPASRTKLQVFSERLAALTNTKLFISDTAPDPVLADQREVRDMVVQAYYIATNADGRVGTPALRVKMLGTDAGNPAFIDRELIRGVEDLQVQFGVDPGDDLDGNGTPDDNNNNGMADFVNGYAAQYVNAGDALLLSGQVVSVRVWVRVRAEALERGFIDNRRYQYANTDFTPNDGFRRVLMSRTIYLRNSRQQ